MAERGNYRNLEHGKKSILFHGMKFGSITPTDIDIFMDFGDWLFVIAEAKYNGAKMPYGQRLAIQRLCDASQDGTRRYACAFLLSHNQHEDVDISKALVKEYRWLGSWRKPKSTGLVFRDAVQSIKEHVELIRRKQPC